MNVKHVKVNGVQLAYLTQGEGPLVVLLHGFPDTAHTWDAVRPALSAAGYRAVTPFLRGYHPSARPDDGRYDPETLGRDVLDLIHEMDESAAIVVGHDFGALAAYAAAALAPERVSLLVTVALPHPAAIKPSLGLLWRGRHLVRFRLPGAARLLRDGNFALVDQLVRRWSPRWRVPEDATEAVKRSLAHPGSAEAAIEYYRQLPVKLPAALRRTIRVPAVVFAGEGDGVVTDLAVYEQSRARFSGGYQVVRMPGGHFLHLEDPERFNDELLAALRDRPRVERAEAARNP